MASFTYQRHIAAPPQTVFDVLTEHDRYAAITPMRKSVLEREGDPAPNGVGAIRVLEADRGARRADRRNDRAEQRPDAFVEVRAAHDGGHARGEGVERVWTIGGCRHGGLLVAGPAGGPLSGPHRTPHRTPQRRAAPRDRDSPFAPPILRP